MTPILTKTYTALTAVDGYLIVAAGDNGVNAAAGSTSLIFGVADSMGAKAGGPLDVHLNGIAEVRAGGTFVFGEPLTSDSAGRAVKAVSTPGTITRVLGIAQSDAVSGDIVPVLLATGAIITPAA